MAIIKPGTIIGGYTWTGKRWAKTPERTADKVAIQKEIEQGKSANINKSAKTMYPGGSPRMSKSSRTTSGSRNAEGPKRSVAKPTAGKTAAANKPAQKPVNKPAPPKQTSATKPATKPSSASKPSTSGSTQKKTAPPKGKPVSQSNTMWVKKGDTVGGETVKKGYLAQYGKPEKKVTAKVKLVAGEKAGQKVTYSKGRKVK